MTGIFIGSFDPFTIGHDAIVRRALPLFDKIVIGVGVNVRKKYLYSAEVRVKDIASLYADEPKIEVKAYSDLAVDFAKREGAQYIIKGVRSIKDFEYEREQADINRKIGGRQAWCASLSTSGATFRSFCRANRKQGIMGNALNS